MDGTVAAKVKLLACVATVGVASAAPAAPAAAKVEVLGIRYGDSWAAAVDKLHAAGLREGVSAHNVDNRTTYEAYVLRRARDRSDDFYGVERQQWFQDDSGRGVTLSGLVTKTGYVVREVNYTFHSDGGLPPVLGALKAKFGTPRTGRERRFGGNYLAFTAPGDRPGVALVVVNAMGSPVLDLGVAFGESDVVATRRMIDAEAAQRASTSPTRSGLRL